MNKRSAVASEACVLYQVVMECFHVFPKNTQYVYERTHLLHTTCSENYTTFSEDLNINSAVFTLKSYKNKQL